MTRTVLDRARELGELVLEKGRQYGHSHTVVAEILAALYPAGIRPDQYNDVLLVARIVDKLARIAHRGADGTDKGGESPYQDIAGYGLLGVEQDEALAADGEVLR